MKKGETIDPFLLKLQEIRDHLTSVGSILDPKFMVRTTLNVDFHEWETSFQSILGKATLLGWEEMWVPLR